jgi:FMN-dependent NADH-azoreductase
LVLGLMGITDVQSIIAEGTSDPQRFSQILQQGIQLAKQQAVQFAQS